ncbi:lysophospholipid acyltransferase family protein [Streptomyces sp. 549]|uniref:lysophospholipid acyltransferase family protein n=1 Tax=Streptomyces sp. 549 TaxID=3049076 RepID=UPI0024C23E6B|nr:lysophospholipid acyltransferase family protein [Streptomyces sp. 549]MDK1472066.1 lysophospholipid acyltransferase family protein [Streptomyces sp. 549]
MTGRPPWLPAAPCTTERCLPAEVPTVGACRQALRLVAALAVLLCGVLAVPFVRRLPSIRREHLVRRWVLTLTTALGVRVHLTGSAAPGPVLVVANHISWLDVPLLAAVKPGRTLAKAEVSRYPVLGSLARLGGTLFIDRERLRALPHTVSELSAALRDGSTVVAFPEAGTWCGRGLGRFRPAVFQAALDAGTAVQPVRIRYRLLSTAPTTVSAVLCGPPLPTTVAAFVGEDTLAASVRRVVSARGLVAEVSVLPALPSGSHPDRRALAGAVQGAVTWPGAEVGPPHRAEGRRITLQSHDGTR